MNARKPVAVLGAGIMGSATALHLARLGVPVTMFDRALVPLSAASRWNEGKIHLGFLYSADPTMATARSMLTGGLDFAGQVERLTGVSIAERTTASDDLYLIHRDSVVTAEAAAAYFDELAAIIRAHPDAGRYLVDVSECRVVPLARAELESVADPELIAAGYRVPERSVDTNFVADAFVNALDAASLIELACEMTVTGVQPVGDGRWFVSTGSGQHGPFAAVVNATWEGRPRIDRSVGHRPDIAPQHRYRLSVFARSERELSTPSAVVAAGPFGDVKNYAGRCFYLSWYPAGLLARAEAVEAPPTPLIDEVDRKRIAAAAFAALGAIMPSIRELEREATDVRVEGGWVYSQGHGFLDDPAAAVHRRSLHGISRSGTYFSVDTGKYSVAPTRAQELAGMVATACAEGLGISRKMWHDDL